MPEESTCIRTVVTQPYPIRTVITQPYPIRGSDTDVDLALCDDEPWGDEEADTLRNPWVLPDPTLPPEQERR
jgi:hypothetical protein